ncbi:DUF2177 family protein [Schlesneria paludicola]|uniref:DUF2177 family protein n=1 Tax=Schlesneria paludicola TaxID=360056 RepID=UPI00029A69A0|nr:DUF2177 family protein [Schlesneria paludicola]
MLRSFLIILPCFLALDCLWIGVLMNSFYNHEIGELARRSEGALAPRWGAALLVYLLIPGGIVVFVRPALDMKGSLLHAFGIGALFGLVVYGVYDLTNRAILQNWSLRMTVIDMVWGSSLCGAMAIMMRLAK